MPRRPVLGWLKDLCSDTKTFVFHNALYDLGWLRSVDIEVKGKIRDTMIVPLLDENRRYYNLNSVAGDYLKIYKDEKMLKGAAEEFRGVEISLCWCICRDACVMLVKKLLEHFAR